MIGLVKERMHRVVGGFSDEEHVDLTEYPQELLDTFK